MELNEKKTICTLCQELREAIKYMDCDKLHSLYNLIEQIQYRAHDMEKGLYKSKFDVGKNILSLLEKEKDIGQNDELICNIRRIIYDRWPLLAPGNAN